MVRSVCYAFLPPSNRPRHQSANCSCSAAATAAAGDGVHQKRLVARFIVPSAKMLCRNSLGTCTMNAPPAGRTQTVMRGNRNSSIGPRPSNDHRTRRKSLCSPRGCPTLSPPQTWRNQTSLKSRLDPPVQLGRAAVTEPHVFVVEQVLGHRGAAIPGRDLVVNPHPLAAVAARERPTVPMKRPLARSLLTCGHGAGP